MKNTVVDGFDNWRAERRDNGGVMLDVNTTAGHTVTVHRGTPGGAAGDNGVGGNQNNHDHDGDGWNDHVSKANCTKMQIASPLVNPASSTSILGVTRTAAHEMGHALGMRHTGRVDSRHIGSSFTSGWNTYADVGTVPLVNDNCAARPDALPQLDDWAQMSQLHGAGNRFSVAANFESTTTTTRAWRGSGLTIETAFPANGDRYLRVAPGASASQVVRIEGLDGSVRIRSKYKAYSFGGPNYKLWSQRFDRSSKCDSIYNYTDASPVLRINHAALDLDGQDTWAPLSGLLATTAVQFYNDDVDLRLEVYNPDQTNLWIDDTYLEES